MFHNNYRNTTEIMEKNDNIFQFCQIQYINRLLQKKIHPDADHFKSDSKKVLTFKNFAYN